MIVRCERCGAPCEGTGALHALWVACGRGWAISETDERVWCEKLECQDLAKKTWHHHREARGTQRALF